MKTLKKSLCLILALVMVLGLCTIGASAAAYTDAAEIQYKGENSIMSELGILVGIKNADGTYSFKPDDIVTRAQAAKMIAYMILGKDTAEKMPATASFTDVNPGDWYAKYVGYCAKQGIINGKVDAEGKLYFDPDAPVTGTELAKMILCAVGYGKAGEYVGSGWDFNAVADALTYGVYSGTLATDFSDGATRDECALYIYNGMFDVEIPTYKDGVYSTDANSQTYSEKTWKIENKTGIVTANQATGKLTTDVVLDGDQEATSFAFATDLSVIGHEVRVLYKSTKSVYNITDISTVIPAFSTVGKLTVAKIANPAYDKDADPPVPEKLTVVNAIANYKVQAGNTAFEAPAEGKTSIYDLIVYNGTIIGYVMPETFNIAKVTAINSKTGAYTLDYNDDGDPVVTGSKWTLCGAAVNDYIEVVAVGDLFITRPTSKFENIKITQITKAKGGVPASYNSGAFVESLAANASDYLPENELTLGKPYNFFADSTGKFFRAEAYVEPNAETTAVFFVKAFKLEGTATVDEYGNKIDAHPTYYAQCVTADGETVNYAVKNGKTEDDVNKTVNVYIGLNPIERGPVNVSFDAFGNATLTEVAADSVEKLAAIDQDFKTAVSKIPGKPYYLADDVKVIVLSGKINPFTLTEQDAELGTLQVNVYDELVGNYTGKDIFVAKPATITAAKTIKTIWIDGAAASAPIPVADSYIYVSAYAAAPDATGYAEDGVTPVNFFNAYVDGVATQIAVLAPNPALGVLGTNELNAGFKAYTLKDGIYTPTDVIAPAQAKEFVLNGTTNVVFGGMFSSTDPIFDGKDISGLKVVDLRTGVGVVPVTDVAGLEALTSAKLDLLMDANTNEFIGVIYVSAIPE